MTVATGTVNFISVAQILRWIEFRCVWVQVCSSVIVVEQVTGFLL